MRLNFDVGVLLSLILITFLLYGRSVNNFLISDDYYAIEVGQNHYGGLQPTDWFYRPVSFMTIYAFFLSFGYNSIPYHLMYLFIHILNAFLVYKIALLFDKKLVGVFSSLLFLVQKFNYEAILWIGGIYDAIVTVFFLSTIFYFLTWLNNRKEKYWYYTAILFTLTLFSKESGVAIIPVLILYHYLTERDVKFWNIRFTLFSVITGIYLFLNKSVESIVWRSFHHYVLLYFAYLELLFMPFKSITTPPSIDNTYFMLLVILIFYFFVFKSKKNIVRLSLISVLFSIIPYLLQSNIQMRYFYLPSTFASVLMVLVLEKVAIWFYNFSQQLNFYLIKIVSLDKLIFAIMTIFLISVSFVNIPFIQSKVAAWEKSSEIVKYVYDYVNAEHEKGKELVIVDNLDSFEGVTTWDPTYILRNAQISMFKVQGKKIPTFIPFELDKIKEAIKLNNTVLIYDFENKQFREILGENPTF